MAAATTIARLLLGLLFTFAGASAFFMTPPHLPGLAGAFNDVFSQSHWSLFLGAAQVVIGVLLLINRFVPLALIMLAAFLYNSFAFHITMAQSSLFAPLIVTALWALISWKYRSLFALLLAPAPPLEQQGSGPERRVSIRPTLFA
ncbi:MAG TPA: DoxX family membrane protein [Candidatus Acidoferrum sp.]|jgi:uncharacterized membrane protein YphA (DoxX/SURF4 family)|nr:DoxX family membrane protein [Candidatus Acidoferrum sp.]